MRPFYLFICFLFLVSIPSMDAQNYLRVSDPNAWDVPITSTPDWAEYRTHGQFDEITIITEPQGIFTEIEFYATISQGPDAYSWTGEYEIVWQFDLPSKSIVHDSWLWIGSDIIKADIIDYWTALQTYEEIVERNQDPSFFYRLSDNRYEIRIYPMFEGESRKIKMSFLVPTEWDLEEVKTDLLNNMLQSTDYGPATIGIGMLVDEQWDAPKFQIDNLVIPMTDTVVNGAGALMHYMEWSGSDFVEAEKTALIVDAPFTDDNIFLSTFSEGSDNFYQLAYVPDWQALTGEPTRSLIILDYNEAKTEFSKPFFKNYVEEQFQNHFKPNDEINLAVLTTNGLQFLSETWWNFDSETFGDTLYTLLEAQDTIDLVELLVESFTWAESQDDIGHIYLMAANDDYVYPPYADEIFLDLENLMPTDIPLTIMDYQNENISIIFYGNEEYEGNEYFYELFEGLNPEVDFRVYRNSSQMFDEWLQTIFPDLETPTGIIDYTTSLENGITYHRYSISDVELNEENQGVILQTGKYLGNFPLHVNANLVTDNGEFYNMSNSIDIPNIMEGDTLMREMWYGPYLKELEILAGSDDDRLAIVEQSIEERVLTGLTAFLALEPSQGGEPCIGCLLNSGTIIPVNTDYDSIVSEASLSASPNPASEEATIRLTYTNTLSAADWTLGIYNMSGRLITSLDSPNENDKVLEWKWEIGSKVSAGVYFCKAQSIHGELTAKIIVLP